MPSAKPKRARPCGVLEPATNVSIPACPLVLVSGSRPALTEDIWSREAESYFAPVQPFLSQLDAVLLRSLAESRTWEGAVSTAVAEQKQETPWVCPQCGTRNYPLEDACFCCEAARARGSGGGGCSSQGAADGLEGDEASCGTALAPYGPLASPVHHAAPLLAGGPGG